MRTKTRVTAGALRGNHNETMIREAVRARGLKIRTGVRGGKRTTARKTAK